METDHFDSKDKSSETDIHNCSICLEEFKTPKYLPCLHTFCEACLNTYIISSSKSGESPPKHFNCPVCRAEVKPPDPSASAEKWASLMPANSTVHSLTEASLTSSEKPTEKTFECHPCKFDGENISGEFWCFECQEFLCDRCKKEHVRHKSLRSHKLVPVTDVTTQTDITVVTNDLEEPCTEHKGEVLKVYCIDHQKMCCVLCLSINHRKCENIETFDEMAENMKKKAEAEQFSDKIKEMSSKVEMISARKKENITDIQKQQTIMLDKADELIQKAKAKLDKCHEEFKYHISNHQKVQTTKLFDAADKIDRFQNCLTSSLKIWTTIRATGSPKQIFVTFERIKERIESQRKELEAYLKVDQIVSFDIKLSKQVLEITDLTSLAEIEVKTTPSEESLSLHIDNCQYQENINASIVSPCINDLEPVRVWNMKNSGWFTGGTFLNDGRLLLLNYRAKLLTVFNECGEKNICYNLNFKPWDAVQHSDGSIYVSSYSDRTIWVYTLPCDVLQEVKCIKTDVSLNVIYAINITPDNQILIECNKCIYIMTMDGKTKRTIKTSNWNSFIATSTSDTGSVFFYCDGNEVVCQSISGKELLRYNIPEIKGTRGISLDTWGNIYICGKDSENVHVVSKDGKSSRVLLSNIGDVYKPYKLGFDRSGSKFFVTGSDNGTVAVYKLNVKT